MNEALAIVRKRGYLLRLENTDGWFMVADEPISVLPETQVDDIADDDAWALIDAGLVKERARYSLGGGTLVWVYTLAEQSAPTQHASRYRLRPRGSLAPV
jgi:hypothetical protein